MTRGRLAGFGLLWVLLGLAASGCVHSGPTNPSYTLTPVEERAELRRLRSEAAKLDRPVVIISGYRQPITSTWTIKNRLIFATSHDRADFVTVDTMDSDSIERIAERTVQMIEARWPSSDDDETVEVDVVGLSMGGLVARHAAIAGNTSKRLRIKRLWTLATPHRGALLAKRLAPDKASQEMKPGSAFLRALDEQLDSRDYELLCYAVLSDSIVGEENTAPPGMMPIWIRGRLMASHLMIQDDDRLLIDLARRIRNEEPIYRLGVPVPGVPEGTFTMPSLADQLEREQARRESTPAAP